MQAVVYGLLIIHRVHRLVARQKTHILNVIRGLLRQFGHVIGTGPVAAMRLIKAFETDEFPVIRDAAKSMLKTLCDQVISLHERVRFYDQFADFRRRLHTKHTLDAVNQLAAHLSCSTPSWVTFSG